MKLDLHDIHITNFKTFATEQVFNFDLSGFHFLTGSNKVDTKLGSNGSGKSTIEDALSVVFFDKMVSGARSSIADPWEGDKKTRLEVNFSIDGERHNLTRTRHPMELTLDGEPTTNGAIETLIKHNHTTFTFAVIHGQKSRSFLDLKPAERLALFSDVQDLDAWIGYSDNAKESRKALVEQLDSVRRTTAQSEGKLEAKESQDFDHDINHCESDRKRRLETLDKSLVAKENLVNEADGARRDAVAEVEKLDEALPKAAKEPLSLQKAKDRLTDAQDAAGDARSAVRAHRAKIRTLEQAKGACTECGASIDISDEKKALKKANKQTSGLEQAQVDAESLVTNKVGKIENIRTKMAKDNEYRVRIQTELTAAERESRRAKQQLASHQQGVVSTKKDIEELNNQVNPFIARKKECEEDIKELKDEIEELNKQASTIEVKADQSQFWIKGFKDVRLYLIESGLKQFEVAANAELEKLGLVGWSIEFAVESETKSQTVTKGFDVWIKTPRNDKKVQYECWSGGEAQRLALAATSGLSSLIEAKLGVIHNVEFYDEPTEGLGEEGIHDLLTALSERASQENKSIWIVDHNQLAWGKFDSTVTIVKDPHSMVQ